MTQRDEAKDPKTPPDRLRALAKSKDEKVRRAIVSNPNTPLDVVFALGEELPLALLRSPVLPLLELERPNWHHLLPAKTVAALLDLLALGWRHRSALASHPDAEVRLLLARHPYTVSPSLLTTLARDRDWSVRRAVAENPSTPAALLETFLSDPEAEVCRAVTRHPNTPPSLLSALARDPRKSVRWAVGSSPRTPAVLLSALAREKDEDLRWHVAQNGSAPLSVLSLLAVDESGSVREAVAQNPSTDAALLSLLAGDEYREVRLAVADHGKTPAAALEALTHDRDEEVREAARATLHRRGKRGG
jgi:hypothetical protein